ncbi:exonuclease subunit SbcD [Pseudomonas mangiferae]|uniref:Nuclease SbcCD subunit D n=1 Tax=Pseudomonas mangiferae TaxID=2593654 RepID=A0A553H1P5_9PSED|nr:exonuclease subunit SbcD [Pseudomonas mangiferae]TRX75674.1 exonuclease subunit SbcD [Pseudomonas mangiferae]
MRLLHTSDWHLGQHFHGKTRQAEHRAFLRWLIEQVREREVDAVLVAGDVFDTGAPPSYARELYNDFIVALRDTGAQLVVLGGNHDSVATLGESRTLLACLNTRVIPAVSDDPDEQVQLLARRDGTPGALLCAIPYIRPRDVLRSEAGQSAEDKQRALQDAIRRHYQALFERAEARRAALGLALPIVATGHLTTVGASGGDAVREIYVGALEAFPTHAFPAADYIALGHIHRPQTVGGLAHVRYSGSPIPLAFDEVGQAKQVLQVDLDADGLRAVTPLPVPCFQPLAALRGTLAELGTALRDAARAGSPERPVWVDALVCGDDYLSDLAAPLAALHDGLPVEVLRIRRERGRAVAGLPGQTATLDELGPLEVFEQRLAGEALADDERERLRQLYRAVLADLPG